MTIKIDPAGRVILPKRVRERLGLRAGAEIELTEAGGELRLRPVQHRPSLVREGPWLVHTGRPAPRLLFVLLVGPRLKGCSSCPT